jgi:hypothetical protein
MTLPWRCPSRKFPFKTRKNALSGASLSMKHCDCEIYVYKCPYCHHYHRTRNDQHRESA